MPAPTIRSDNFFKDFAQYGGLATSVGTGWTTIAQFRVFGGIINAEISSAAGSATTTGFRLQIKDHPTGEFYDLLADVEFDDIDIESMIFCSTTGPHELVAEGVAHVIARIWAAVEVRIQAKVGASTATLTAKATASNRAS